MNGSGLQLRVPREKAGELLVTLAEQGDHLRDTGDLVKKRDEVDAWLNEYDRWVKLSEEALRSMFAGDGAAEEFKSAARLGSFNRFDSWTERHARWMKVLGRATNALVSFRERLAFAADSSDRGEQQSDVDSEPVNEKRRERHEEQAEEDEPKKLLTLGGFLIFGKERWPFADTPVVNSPRSHSVPQPSRTEQDSDYHGPEGARRGHDDDLCLSHRGECEPRAGSGQRFRAR